MRTYVHTYTRTYVHTYIRTYVHTYIRTSIRTYNVHNHNSHAVLSDWTCEKSADGLILPVARNGVVTHEAEFSTFTAGLLWADESTGNRWDGLSLDSLPMMVFDPCVILREILSSSVSMCLNVFMLALEVSLHLAAGYRTFPYLYHSFNYFNYFHIADSMPWGRYGLHRRRWAHCSHSFAAGLRRILICSDRCRELSTAEICWVFSMHSPCILYAFFVFSVSIVIRTSELAGSILSADKNGFGYWGARLMCCRPSTPFRSASVSISQFCLSLGPCAKNIHPFDMRMFDQYF